MQLQPPLLGTTNFKGTLPQGPPHSRKGSVGVLYRSPLVARSASSLKTAMSRSLIFVAIFNIAFGAAAPLFSCEFDGFLLSVLDEPTYPYCVSSSLTGSPWLENGTLAIQSGGRILTPGAGLEIRGTPEVGSGVDGTLGAYDYLAISWNGSSGEAVTSNFTCYVEFGLASFSLLFPDGLAPLYPGTPGIADVPTTRFPCFSANPGSELVSDAMGFVTWAGEMDTYKNAHGTGLKGYSGGWVCVLLIISSDSCGLAASLFPASPAGARAARFYFSTDLSSRGGLPPHKPSC